jgi:hypothetical protein
MQRKLVQLSLCSHTCTHACTSHLWLLTCLQVLLLAVYNLVALQWVQRLQISLVSPAPPLLSSFSRMEVLYLLGLLWLEVYCSVLHPYLPAAAALPFMPLMLTSLYCALGMSYAWWRLAQWSLWLEGA